jgi:N-acetyltransferase
MDLQPTLVGELTVVRPMVAEDWDAVYGVASDPLIWAIHPAHDRWQEPVFRKFFDDALASGGGLVILDKATGAAIGASRYANHDAARDEIEIGWTFLARSHWGGRYNGEVKRMMVDHIHRFVGTAVFLVGEGNLRSQRAMEKVGGVRQAEMRERVYSTGLHRQMVFAISRPA